MIQLADNRLLNHLSNEAKLSERKRKNHNFHSEYSDTLQRLLNAMEPGTYIRPHKHENPDKREAFWIIRGTIAVVVFNDMGNVIAHYVLNREKGCFGIDLPFRIWHCLISLERGSVAYEVKDGPYDPNNDKSFAPWAPQEADNDLAQKWLDQLIKQLGLKIENP